MEVSPKIGLLLLLSISLLLISSSHAEDRAKQTFVIVYSPGANWLPNTPVFGQPLQNHIDYMTKLHREKKLLSGGPFTDNAGGLAIIHVNDVQEAKAILANDPAITEKVLCAQMHPWLSIYWSDFLRKASYEQMNKL